MLHCKFSGDYNSERIFLNWPIFDEVMCRAFGVHFFGPPCRPICPSVCNVVTLKYGGHLHMVGILRQ